MRYLFLLERLVEKLRIDTIGEPVWINEKNVFEYMEDSIEVATILKLIRMNQTLFSMVLLCQHGFFIDMSALFRIVNDTVTEIYFLLEYYPKRSEHIDKYLKEFFSRRIEQTDDFEPSVPIKKIQSAMVRKICGKENSELLESSKKIHKVFSGYIHGGYSHIMQMYGPKSKDANFKISGIPSQIERENQFAICYEAIKSVYICFCYVAQAFGKSELEHEAYKISEEME